MLFATVAALLAPFLFALLWLAIAARALGLFARGIWAFFPRDEDDAPAGPLPPIRTVSDLLMAEDFQVARLSQEERTVLGKQARHTPRVFVGLQKELRHGALGFIQPLVIAVFWGTIGALFLGGLLLVLTNTPELLFPVLNVVWPKAVASLWLSGGILALLMLALGVVEVVLDLRMARALAPRSKPVATKHIDLLRELTVNMPPQQFLSVLRTALAVKLSAARFPDAIGFDKNKDGFIDQSSFSIEMQVEAIPSPTQNFAEGPARRYLWQGAGICLLGAAFALFMLLPASFYDLISGQPFDASGMAAALVWMLACGGVAQAGLSVGSRQMKRAETVLDSAWHRGAVTVIRFDGTMNTQTVLTGRAQDDSYGSENRLQQIRFDARLVGATLTTVAAEEEAPREIASFEADDDAMKLTSAIAEVLKSEGAKSSFSAVGNTVLDTQKLSEASALRKAELQLKLAQTQAELRQLEQSKDDPEH